MWKMSLDSGLVMVCDSKPERTAAIVGEGGHESIVWICADMGIDDVAIVDKVPGKEAYAGGFRPLRR